jgi:hypothetical protein
MVVLAIVATLGLVAPVEASLVAYWPLDGNGADLSGNGHTGTPTNVTFSGNVPAALGGGQSATLNGSAWVQIPADPGLNSSTFTLAFWINQDGQTQGPGSFPRTTSRGGDTLETALRNSPSGQLSFYPGWPTVNYTLQPSGWQHVLYVASGGQMKVYVGGREWYPAAAFTSSPSGLMNIGARWNNTEGVKAKMDDVALWNTPLSATEVRALAGGLVSPPTLARLGPQDLRATTVLSNATQWALSTVRDSGGAPGAWAGPFPAPPAAATFTLPAPAGTTGEIIAAGNDFGSGGTLNGDGGGGNPTGVQYYRTLFTLQEIRDVTAHLVLAADNGARVFINGVEVARETSFLVENWARPYSGLTINADGSLGGLTLFDWTVSSFINWQVGQNEVILAIRNPDSEGIPGGAIAFRMDIVYTVPEPCTLSLLALGSLALCRRRRRRR